MCRLYFRSLSQVQDSVKFNRLAFTLALAGSALSCSGAEQDQRPPSGTLGGTGFTHEEGPCDPGTKRICGQTVEQANGIITCFRGEQVCDDGTWSKCQDGVVTRETDPTVESAAPELREFSLSMPAACIDNPCDPSCMFFDEDPTDITPPASGGVPTIPNWQTAGGTASCSHELCEPGLPLDPSCHGCVETVCDLDPSCCTGNGATDDWDDTCIDLVYTACGGSPVPPKRINLCDLAAFGENSIRFGNGGTGRPQIASEGNITLETNCEVGSIYSKGLVNLRNGCDIYGEVVTEGSAFLEASASSILYGDLWTGGYSELRNNSSVRGSVTAGTTITLASDAYIQDDAYAGGNIVLNNPSDIFGNATSASNITGQPNGRIAGIGHVGASNTIAAALTVGTRDVSGTVAAPIAPVVELPTLEPYRRDLSASCSAAASRADYTLTAHQTLSPGIYGDIVVNGGYTLILETGGTYVFNSVTFYGGSGGFRLAGTAPWDVSFCGKLDLHGGVGIYLDGSTTKPPPEDLILYSAATSGDGISFGDGTDVDAVALAPDSQIRVYNNFQGTGAFWGKTVHTDTGIDLTGFPAGDCENMDLGGTVECDGVTELHTDWTSYSIGDKVHKDGVIYECIAADCGQGTFTPGVDAPQWTSRWAVDSTCPSSSIPSGGASGGSCPVTLDLPGMPDPQAPCYSGEECQINSHCTEVLTDASCSHSKCAVGGALSASCDSCVDRICDIDSTCCSTSWSSACVALVESTCDASCGAVTAPACSHDLCVTGAAVDQACSTEAADVCAVIPSCCDLVTPGVWDQACVDQLYLNETGSVPATTPGESICDYSVLGSGSAALYSTTINGTVGWLKDPVTMVGGTLVLYEQYSGAGYPTISGDVLVSGQIDISNGQIAGDAYASGTITRDAGTTANSFNENDTTLPSPAAPTVTFSCPVPSPNYSYSYMASGTLPVGNYDGIDIDGPVNFLEGDYYLNRLTIRNGGELILPATGDVNIYICDDLQMIGGSAATHATITSPANDPLQLRAYIKNGVANLGDYAEVVGAIQVEDGNINAGRYVEVYGLLHSYRSTINTHLGTVIDSTGVTGSACLNRGLDPSTPVTVCPVTTPVTDTVTESGTCVDNGVPPTHSQSWCSGEADLALYLSCDPDTVPVCNHGDVTVPAGEAELVFYPRIASQFAGAEPEAYWEAGRCAITDPIAPGSCVDQVCDPTLMNQDMTVRVEMSAGATVSECSDQDNWSYFIDAPACSGGSGTLTLNYEYEAVCDNDRSPAWGLLTWNSTTPGASDITFRGRTATTSAGLASEAWTPLGVARQAAAPNDTQVCWVGSTAATCPPDLTGLLYSSTPSNQGTFVELEITLESDGADAPTLNDWRVTYSCLEDQ